MKAAQLDYNMIYNVANARWIKQEQDPTSFTNASFKLKRKC